MIRGLFIDSYDSMIRKYVLTNDHTRHVKGRNELEARLQASQTDVWKGKIYLVPSWLLFLIVYALVNSLAFLYDGGILCFVKM